MRQTSRAVALLLTLESAQAAFATQNLVSQTTANSFTVVNTNIDYTTQFNTALGADQATNRMSQYRPATNLPAANTYGTILAMTATSFNNNATTAPTTVTAGSKCTPCILGGGVWCSRTYAYSSTQTSGVLLQGQLATGTIGMRTYPNNQTSPATATAATDANMIGGAGLDGGSCCAVKVQAWNTALGIGTIGAATTTAINNQATDVASGSSTSTLVGESCVVFKKALIVAATGGGTNGTLKVGAFLTDTSAIARASWWCSNGLYSRVTGASAALNNVKQPLMGSQNQRTELALVACPQVKSTCGAVDVVQDVDTTATIAISLTAAAGLPSADDKCTWVATSLFKAPTFTIEKNTTLGLITPNWQIHSMEYTGTNAAGSTSDASVDGSLVQNRLGTGFLTANHAINLGNLVPMFDMPQNQFSMLRTWYGAGATRSATVNGWTSPYQNVLTRAQSGAAVLVPQQKLGNVSNFPSSTANSGTTAGTGDYGKVSITALGAGSAADVSYDVRVVRYFPAQVAAASWTAGNTLYGTSGSYATAVTAYTTAKTNWDAYVALLAKNAKADAFAAAFSPPKAPTVPPLPSQPWVPGSYAGYYKQTPFENKVMMQNTGTQVTAAQPTNQQFWTSMDAANTTGGWGTFTAQILAFRDGYGKSFGTIGYSGDANKLLKSAVWNSNWTCGSGATGTAGSLCDKIYTVSADATVASSTGNNAPNTVPLYVAVSLWSLGNTNGTTASYVYAFTTGSARNDFKITFTASAWDTTIVSYTNFAAPAPTTAASSLTGIAGAQALAASAAAALAAAAALY